MMSITLTLLHVFFSLSFAITGSTLAISLSKPGCPEKCGNATIPFPFGIGSECSANSSFTVICNTSTNPPTLFLSSIKMEAANISLSGTIIVKQLVSPVNCSYKQKTISLLKSLEGTPFTISGHYNTLVVLGCKNSVWLRANKTMTVGGCTALCDVHSSDTSCNGVNCCQTTVPPGLKEMKYTYKSIEARSNIICGYIFPVEKKWLKKDYRSCEGGLKSDLSNPFDREFGFVPLVLEWEFGELKGFSDGICIYFDDYCTMHTDNYDSKFLDDGCNRRCRDNYCSLYPDDNHHCQLSAHGYDHGYSYSEPYYEYLYSEFQTRYHYYYYSEYDFVSSTKYCSCPKGYQGNPYLPEGCRDINECIGATTDRHCLTISGTCINKNGSFICAHQSHVKTKIATISTGSALGGLIFLIGGWKSTEFVRKRIKTSRKRKHFKRNGGLLLEQQLSSTDNGLEKMRLFSSKELAKATDHYDENRVLGCGGHGIVYKGMLTDGRIVAVKKSKRIDEANLQVFINEVVILSQINHRNVVKLLGCCLETEVPLLVYEFIPNGTLFQHIFDRNEEFPLTWEMRVRIAREVAGALAYLHSAASAPIYHRDIKSTNILLDEKYRAKVSDFGTSRSVAIDQTHLTTRVLGTFGYLDPEYFQSNQLTEKSDVYSFGVVMVELLTGEKAISSMRAESGRSLATHFLMSMEENKLFEILDMRVLKEGKREEIVVIAKLARRCLHLNGKIRPTMKEVAAELERIQMAKEGRNLLQNQNGSREYHSTEILGSCDFSCISSSMHFDTIGSYSSPSTA